MTTNLKPIPGVPTVTPGTAVVVYTAPGDNTAVVSLVIFNPSGSTSATYSVHVVPSAGSPSTNNKFIIDQSILPKERHTSDDKIFLNNGDTIQLVADLAGIVCRGSVAELS